MEVKTNILGDYAQILRKRLIDDVGYPESAVAIIPDDGSLILAYLRVYRRLVSNVPRAIFKAKGFACPPEHVDALAQIERKIRNGESINPYLSRKLINIGYNDPLLNDWGIQHLHLGERVSTEGKHRGFIKGTKELLYVYFDKQCAYFIKILGHGSDFADQILIQTIHDNWPEVLKPYRDPNIISVYPRNPTSTERHKLRQANLNVGIVTVSDGTTYVMIGGSVMTSGDNILDVMQTNHLHRWADHQTNAIMTEKPEIIAKLKARGLEIVEPVVLRLSIEDDSEKHWFLFDERNRFRIPITGPWGAPGVAPGRAGNTRGHHRAPRRRPLMGEGGRPAERHRAPYPYPYRRPMDAPGRPPGPPGART